MFLAFTSLKEIEIPYEMYEIFNISGVSSFLKHTVVSTTSQKLTMLSNMSDGSHLGFRIQLVSFDKSFSMVLRRFYAKGYICNINWPSHDT